jgi:hypothetical protein
MLHNAPSSGHTIPAFRPCNWAGRQLTGKAPQNPLRRESGLGGLLARDPPWIARSFVLTQFPPLGRLAAKLMRLRNSRVTPARLP